VRQSSAILPAPELREKQTIAVKPTCFGAVTSQLGAPPYGIGPSDLSIAPDAVTSRNRLSFWYTGL
jgi:hypothetical protein